MARRLAHFRDPNLEMQIEELLKVMNPLEITVTGSAVTSVSFTGLDGNAHGGYVLEALIYNPIASAQSYSIYINGDLTQTNYWSQYIFANSSTITATVNNAAMFMGAEASTVGAATLNIYLSPSGFVSCTSLNSRGNDKLLTYGVRKIASVTNLTQIDIAGPSGTIGVGSRFRLFRRL